MRRYPYDAFVSYAVEDKIPFVNELVDRLTKANVTVWYAGRELRYGGSISDTIHEGLRKSRFGIVVLSRNYISKTWTLREFYSLYERHLGEYPVLIPILWDVTPRELAEKDLDMANIFSIDAGRGMDHVIHCICTEIDKRKRERRYSPRIRSVSLIILVLAALMSGVFWLYTHWNLQSQPNTELTHDILGSIIEHRIHAWQKEINETLLTDNRGRAISIDSVNSIYTTFWDTRSRYRNVYTFSNGNLNMQGRRAISDALLMPVENLTPASSYTMEKPNIRLVSDEQVDKKRAVRFQITNSQPLTYTIIRQTSLSPDEYRVEVTYTNYVRALLIMLEFPASGQDIKRHTVSIQGFMPTEYFNVRLQGSQWTYTLER